jgi:hypothetical protein
MPRHDQTGPMVYGPKTGRGAGLCAGDSEADHMSQMRGPGFGYGFGRMRGFGGGMGRGRRARWGGFFAQPTPQDERGFLNKQKRSTPEPAQHHQQET